MANKVRFGLANAKYALYNAQSGAYGSLKDMPGAVSLSLSTEGGDSSDFYADNGVYYTFSGTNGGYTAELELARITDAMRVDLLGEVADSTTGVQFETTNAEPAQFALVCEMLGDAQPVGFVFYNCKASRPEMNANTKNDSPDVDTDTLNIRISWMNFTYDGVSTPFVQGHIEKSGSTDSKYTAFFASVVTPGSTGLSA